ncbi:GATA transcription factor 5 [Dorcoceras hygrometricum]|uniref:GATA transcription factor n=1 Tax=Dorcoceras hygrometricum TaxID=472368 RepID=A0A2Z7CPQ4_9LAMI|nr:GATA transcription factor 5 [Dorcoceras hygrometricum]
MECELGALKSGFEPETAEAEVAAPFVDDVWCVNGVMGDDFFVDELLDFSNGSFSEGETEEKEPGQKESGIVSEEKVATPEKLTFSGNGDFGSLPCSEPGAPAEGLESLEWLSQFIEDSFSDNLFAGKWPHGSVEHLPMPAAAGQKASCFKTPVQTKARTKRSRTGVRVWPMLSPSLTESSTSSSSSTHSTMSFSPPKNFTWKPPAKKHGKKQAEHASAGGSSGGVGLISQPRRCSHCGVTKTPQWRAGPQGSKTLCNACGVRYKSGRLLPEYRPACSPTFSMELHSNNHRRVLEMRRKKESEMEAAGLLSPVQSF